MSDAVPHVVVVEDESDVRDLMALHLTRGGYKVTVFPEGGGAEKFFALNSCDLAVLDWMLPGVSGLEICRHLAGRIPVLMVTAKAADSDIVTGLDAGADDYITKPFEKDVFLARVRAILRRHGGRSSRDSGIVIDTERHEASLEGSKIDLTNYEYNLLRALLSNRGRVLSRGSLIKLVQGDGVSVIARTIDTLVCELRKKLGKESDFIETVRGVGYRLKNKDSD